MQTQLGEHRASRILSLSWHSNSPLHIVGVSTLKLKVFESVEVIPKIREHRVEGVELTGLRTKCRLQGRSLSGFYFEFALFTTY